LLWDSDPGDGEAPGLDAAGAAAATIGGLDMTGGDIGCDTPGAGRATGGAEAATALTAGVAPPPLPFTAGVPPCGGMTTRWPPVRPPCATDGGEEPAVSPAGVIFLPHEPQNRAPASTLAPH
jgi:hypothetical protein